MTKILLTGGSGFIAAHILEQLIAAGHEVVTTVRSEEKAAPIRKAYPNAKLTVAIVPDIAQPDAFDEVVKTPGLEAVLHTASPFHYNWTDARKELLDPAIIGTTGILKALKRSAPAVRRVVVTSSFAAVLSEKTLKEPRHTFSEADWNSLTYDEAADGAKPTAYRGSKTLAERAAWEFVDKEKPGFDLATICPPLVFGPVVHHLASLAAINTSNERIAALVQGKWRREIPDSGIFLWVDVRDVARAHVRALEVPAAAGQRFFATAGYYSNRQILDLVRRDFPEYRDQLPDEGLEGGGFPAGDDLYRYDNSRATKVLGIEWTSLEQSIKDTVQSLKSVGA